MGGWLQTSHLLVVLDRDVNICGLPVRCSTGHRVDIGAQIAAQGCPAFKDRSKRRRALSVCAFVHDIMDMLPQDKTI